MERKIRNSLNYRRWVGAGVVCNGGVVDVMLKGAAVAKLFVSFSYVLFVVCCCLLLLLLLLFLLLLLMLLFLHPIGSLRLIERRGRLTEPLQARMR